MILGIKEGAKRFPHPHRCPFFLSLRHPGKKGRKKLKPKTTHPTPKKKNQHNPTQHNTTQHKEKDSDHKKTQKRRETNQLNSEEER
jgi:hypothetical protein